MTISEAQEMVHSLAKQKGWWDGDEPNVPEKLALVHSEISEALEEYRNGPMELNNGYQGDNGKPEGFPVELADAVIRIMDLCGWIGIDLENEIVKKHCYNMTRPFRHGNKRC